LNQAEKPEAKSERLSRMSAASLRINESLDFDTALQKAPPGRPRHKSQDFGMGNPKCVSCTKPSR